MYALLSQTDSICPKTKENHDFVWIFQTDLREKHREACRGEAASLREWRDCLETSTEVKVKDILRIQGKHFVNAPMQYSANLNALKMTIFVEL